MNRIQVTVLAAAIASFATAASGEAYTTYKFSQKQFNDLETDVTDGEVIVGFDGGAFQAQIETDILQVQNTDTSTESGLGGRVGFEFLGGFEAEVLTHQLKSGFFGTDTETISEIGIAYTEPKTGIYGRLSAFRAPTTAGTDQNGYSVNLGYKAFDNLDIQLGLFEAGDDQFVTYNVTFDNEQVSQDLFVLRQTDNFTIVNWEIDVTLPSNIILGAESGVGFYNGARQVTSFGIGAGYAFNGGLDVFAKAMRYEFNGEDIDAFEFGVNYTFNKRGMARTGVYSNVYRRLLSSDARLLLGS